MTSTFRPVLILMTGRAVGYAVTFCLPVVLARIFDQAVFGTYKQLFLIFYTIYGIAQLGMAESLFYFLPVASQDAARYVVNSLLTLAAAGFACLALLIAIGPTLAGWMSNPELSALMPLLGIYLLLMLISSVLEIVMIARKHYRLAAWSYACSDLGRTALCILPVLVWPTLEGLLWGALTCAVLRLGLTWWYLVREFYGDLRLDWEVLKRQFAYALPYELYVLAQVAQNNFHQYAVSYQVDAAMFAIYAVGCLQIPLVDLMTSSSCNVMMVRMTEEIRDGHSAAEVTLWHEMTRKLAFVLFPLVGLLLVNAREIIVLLFTQTYLASTPIFMVWSTAIVLAALPVDAVLRVYAQTRFLFLINAIRLVVIVALIHWFLTTLHLVGAVLITVLAAAIGKTLGLARMKRLMRVDLAGLLPWRHLGTIGLAATAAALLALLVKSSVELAALPLVATTSLVYVGSYLAFAKKVPHVWGTGRATVWGWLQRLSAGPWNVEKLPRN